MQFSRLPCVRLSPLHYVSPTSSVLAHGAVSHYNGDQVLHVHVKTGNPNLTPAMSIECDKV
jgi:hypothetical protein